MATHSSILAWRISMDRGAWQPSEEPDSPWGCRESDRTEQLGTAQTGGAKVKNPSADAGDIRDEGLIPGSRRSPGGGNGNPLQYSCLGNPMDRGAWWPTFHGVTKKLDTT